MAMPAVPPAAGDVTGALSPGPGAVGTGSSDAELIAAARAGDGSAYGVLYERHRDAARRLAYHLTGRADDAEDAVAETFARVLAAIRRGSGPTEAFRPYLLAALRHVAADQRRGQRGQVPVANEDLPDPGQPFADPALVSLERSLVTRAFRSLPERWSAVLWHTEVEQARPAEVALIFGLTPNAVSALSHRAAAGVPPAPPVVPGQGRVRADRGQARRARPGRGVPARRAPDRRPPAPLQRLPGGVRRADGDQWHAARPAGAGLPRRRLRRRGGRHGPGRHGPGRHGPGRHGRTRRAAAEGPPDRQARRPPPGGVAGSGGRGRRGPAAGDLRRARARPLRPATRPPHLVPPADARRAAGQPFPAGPARRGRLARLVSLAERLAEPGSQRLAEPVSRDVAIAGRLAVPGRLAVGGAHRPPAGPGQRRRRARSRPHRGRHATGVRHGGRRDSAPDRRADTAIRHDRARPREGLGGLVLRHGRHWGGLRARPGRRRQLRYGLVPHPDHHPGGLRDSGGSDGHQPDRLGNRALGPDGPLRLVAREAARAGTPPAVPVTERAVPVHSPARRRIRFTWARRRLAASRRSRAARAGWVGRRRAGGGAVASASSSASLDAAASRFRSWERCSAATTVSTPSVSLPESASSARSFSRGGSAFDPARSNESSTLVSAVFTDCPPGPEDRENLQVSSSGGTRLPRTTTFTLTDRTRSRRSRSPSRASPARHHCPARPPAWRARVAPGLPSRSRRRLRSRPARRPGARGFCLVCQNGPVRFSDLRDGDAPARPARDDRYRWTEEGAHPVAPGVHRIPLPLPFDGLRAVNTYVIEASDGLVMIDSGWVRDETRRQLERSLARIGAGLGDVRRFLITHVHRDHYTQAIALREAFGSKVALGAEEKQSLDVLLRRDGRGMAAQAGRLIAAGAQPLIDRMAQAGMTPPAADAGYAEPDEWIADGQVFDLGTRTLEAIATPGHTRGHVVFADRSAGLLFAGDHVLPHITPSISFEAAPSELPLRDFLRSLRLVRQMPDMALLPAHGPVAPSVHARVDELLDHHEARLAAMRAVIAQAPATAYEVALAIRWTSRERELTDLDLVNQTLAVGETECHLDLLVARGLASVTVADGIRRYRLAG